MLIRKINYLVAINVENMELGLCNSINGRMVWNWKAAIEAFYLSPFTPPFSYLEIGNCITFVAHTKHLA